MAAVAAKLRFNGHSMVGALERVMVCSPRTAGWNQAERVNECERVGFLHTPNFAEAQAQHEALCRELREAGVDVLEMPAADDLTLDAVYTHDASLATDYGLILMRPGKTNRVAEAARHGEFCEHLEIPRLGAIAGTTTHAAAGGCAALRPLTAQMR